MTPVDQTYFLDVMDLDDEEEADRLRREGQRLYLEALKHRVQEKRQMMEALRQSRSFAPEQTYSAEPEAYDFRTLPAELRNTIYHFTLVNDDPIEIRTIKQRPGITQACKQTRRETTSLFFAENTFCATISAANFRCVSRWLASLSQHERALIPPLVLKFGTHFCYESRDIRSNGLHGVPPVISLHEFIESLSVFDINASELDWSDFIAPLHRSHDGEYDVEKYLECVGQRMRFNTRILQPLLKIYRLLDDEHPLPDAKALLQRYVGNSVFSSEVERVAMSVDAAVSLARGNAEELWSNFVARRLYRRRSGKWQGKAVDEPDLGFDRTNFALTLHAPLHQLYRQLPAA